MAMAGFLYLCGFVGLIGAVLALLTSPVLMLTPAISAILGAILLFGFGRLIDEAISIQKNTREAADYFRWLRERQERQQPKP